MFYYRNVVWARIVRQALGGWKEVGDPMLS